MVNVLSKNKKNILKNHLKIIIFTVFKNRCILHRHVCVKGIKLGIDSTNPQSSSDGRGCLARSGGCP